MKRGWSAASWCCGGGAGRRHPGHGLHHGGQVGIDIARQVAVLVLHDGRLGRGPGNVAPGAAGQALPLVADGAQAIQVSERVAGRQGLVLGGDAAGSDAADRQAVALHGAGLSAGHALQRAMAIGVAGEELHLSAYFTRWTSTT